MPRQAGTAIENNFKNGLITQATGLNFPENACTETQNCIFNFDGSVDRRLGFDFEDNFATKTINRTNSVVTTYLWKNVSGNGDINLVVVQVGATLYFYNVDSSTSTSLGALVTTVALSNVSGAPTAETIEAQFASGNGLLFVTHPYCEPMYITYVSSTLTATSTNITLKIRDLEGDTTDVSTITSRPTGARTGITKAHLYNLYNQGWNLANLNTWDGSQTTMPSNADVMWAFKNASDAFDMATLANVINGNSPAPKGHYITTLSATDRNTQVSTDDGTTITTVTESNTSFYRPSTCAFFAGRAFYAGIQYSPFNTRIYFSQIIQRTEQYGWCYQQNDPTSESNFDLLADDGGVISIPEAGTIIKLFAIIGGLVVFAQKGIWLITGSTGIGFTAIDYTVQKLSAIANLSAKSFVDIGGRPSWWATEGIYLLSSDQSGNPSVQSLTFDKVKDYYDSIPTDSKSNAKGSFNYVTGVAQWIFRSTASGTANEDYEFDTVLNLNMGTGAFYPWTIPSSSVSINSIVLLDGTTGNLTSANVVDDSANLVIDDSGNQVIAFSSTNSGVIPQFAYLVSYASGGSYKFTFAAARNTDYVDWFQYDDTGTNYTSYFVSGYKIRGDALRKWTNNFLTLYSRNDTTTQFYIQGLWDYATSSTTKRWSAAQLITNSATNYGYLSHRSKIRGSGKALQFYIYSKVGIPFSIIGWSAFDTADTSP